ncbi:coactosin-like protein [Suricata suricatta]|nr:coactosin-like protein [Suricata suricatta]
MLARSGLSASHVVPVRPGSRPRPGTPFRDAVTEPCALFLLLPADDVRLFAFVRFTTGDAMSKRSKFALITWIGENVSGLQRAKTGTDKTLVKEVVQNFAKEFVISDRKELEEDFIKSELKKAGGANYDAQTE